MRPKIESANGETIVCLGDHNCIKWVRGKERQALLILNASCDEARETLRQLGYDTKAITELTKDACNQCPPIDPRFCENPGSINTWRPMYIPYSKYNTLPTKIKDLINELMGRGIIKKLTCCVQYNEECKCIKTEHGYFITARVVDYDKCIKHSRNECVMTVMQAIYEVFKSI